jgi:hypothetical protein
MKHISPVPKAALPAASVAQHAGIDGVALAPPVYGIDLLDRAVLGPGQERQAPGVGEALQMKASPPSDGSSVGAHMKNKTGLPDDLKAGIEHRSGLSLDDVRVHYNSPRPAQLQALAYAQGTDIHVGPGQERHLPHEAWHVVQQKQGRVRPTGWVHGTAINDDAGLEREASVIGAKAGASGARAAAGSPLVQRVAASPKVVQMITENDSETPFIAMNFWGHRKLLKEGNKITTTAMGSCVSIAIYNESGDAILAHFGGLTSSPKIEDVREDVTDGVKQLNTRISQFGESWAGWIWTGVDKDTSVVSELRIDILTEYLNAKLTRVGPFVGGTLLVKNGKIQPVWEAQSELAKQVKSKGKGKGTGKSLEI